MTSKIDRRIAKLKKDLTHYTAVPYTPAKTPTMASITQSMLTAYKSGVEDAREEQVDINKIITRLKKDNTRSSKQAEESGFTNWDIKKTKCLVDTYLDGVLRLIEEEKKK